MLVSMRSIFQPELIILVIWYYMFQKSLNLQFENIFSMRRRFQLPWSPSHKTGAVSFHCNSPSLHISEMLRKLFPKSQNTSEIPEVWIQREIGDLKSSGIIYKKNDFFCKNAAMHFVQCCNVGHARAIPLTQPAQMHWHFLLW